MGIAGGVCLLLWGSYMVRRGVERAYASRLGALVSGATGSRARAVFSRVSSSGPLPSVPPATFFTPPLVPASPPPPPAAPAGLSRPVVGSAAAVRGASLGLLVFSPPF
ncbi:MAG: hypothetical protein MPK10_06745, partial [Gammaproteobacteria bacterium]|nr:hypothetical protein [Gammaproteobacteria bacterium]